MYMVVPLTHQIESKFEKKVEKKLVKYEELIENEINKVKNSDKK